MLEQHLSGFHTTPFRAARERERKSELERKRKREFLLWFSFKILAQEGAEWKGGRKGGKEEEASRGKEGNQGGRIHSREKRGEKWKGRRSRKKRQGS